MIFTCLCKIIGTGVGLYLALNSFNSNPYWGAAFVGILPIFFEVGATLLSGLEPSLETRPILKIIDNLVDGICFLWVPITWFSLALKPDLAVSVFLLLFLACGTYRLIRFVRIGLVDGLYFEGLPVTYTGYMWIFLSLLFKYEQFFLVELVLALASVAMVWRKIRIKRTLTRYDSA